MYDNPNMIQHPSVFAVKTYVEYLNRIGLPIAACIDFHAHSSKIGAFMFGNSLDLDR